MTDSPFMLDRFEYEQEHLYFLQDDVYRELERTKPLYLIGSRGTGKTTLLKALDWRERLRNHSLRSRLGDNPLSGKFLGVYLKLPEIQLGMIDHWLSEQPERNRADIVALYLDLLVLEEVLDAVSYLVAHRHLDVAPDSEIAFSEWLRSDHPKTFPVGDDRYPPTFRGIAKALQTARRRLEDAARFREPVEAALRQLDMVGQIGEFGRRLTTRLYHLPGIGCHFKVAMDEGECLTDFQQLILNSTVRLRTFPLFYVVSFVSLPNEHAATLLPNLTLQRADRILLTLDDLTSQQFKTLSEGVASVRVEHQLSSPARFDLEDVLGPLEINRILEAILRDSVDPMARDLLDAAVTAMAGKDKAGDEAPPIYQTYLDRQMASSGDEAAAGAAWERRRRESALVRKQMVAAYLSICRRLGRSPRYESAKMVLQMSDLCIRDMLNQLHHLFNGANVGLDRFLHTRVTSPVQNRALRRASEEKERSIPESGVGSPRETGALVRGLAELTARIQSESATGRHLRSSEMGIFRLDLAASGLTRSKGLPRLVEEAAEAGFLRVLDSDPGLLKFRVHTSLAASFGFSYRGAYYECPVSVQDLESLRTAEPGAEPGEAIARLAARISGATEGDLPLFKGRENDAG